MRYNDIDPTSLHRAITIDKEIPPGMPPREVITVRGIGGETLGGIQQERGEYIVRVNIAGRTPQEAWRVREMLAAWACAPGYKKTAKLEPTHRPGVYYDAILGSIEPPEFRPRFATVKMTFILPDPHAKDIAPSSISGESGMEFAIGGTADAQPTIVQTIASDADIVSFALDGAEFMRLLGGFTAGQALEVDFETGSVTLDGERAERRIDFTACRWRPGFTPGRHTLISSDAGQIELRWRNRWM